MQTQRLLVNISPDSKIHELIDKLMDQGITYVGCTVGSVENGFMWWASDREMRKAYNGPLADNDPLFNWCLENTFKVFTWDAIPTTKEQKTIMKQRFEICDIKKGLTVTQKKDSVYEMLSIGTNLDKINLPDFCCENFSALINLSSEFRKYFFNVEKIAI